jgi:uncharacterized repeat protein (TIGR04076 family)
MGEMSSDRPPAGQSGGAAAGQEASGTPQTAPLYDLRVVVERIEGRPVCGMRPGDWFELTESSHLRTCPGRFFCVYALASALPLLAAKQRQLPPGEWLEQDMHVACPDPDERVIMRIERTGQRTIPLHDVT